MCWNGAIEKAIGPIIIRPKPYPHYLCCVITGFIDVCFVFFCLPGSFLREKACGVYVTYFSRSLSTEYLCKNSVWSIVILFRA